MGLLTLMLPSALASAFIAAIIMAFGRWRQRSFAGLGIGVGYAAGHALAAGWPALIPANATQWLFCFALVAAAVGQADEFIRLPRVVTIAIWTVVFAAALRLLLQPKFHYTWKGSEAWLWLGAIIATSLLWSAGMAMLDRPAARLELPLDAVIISAGTAIALILSGSLLLGQLAVVVGATSATALIFGFLTRAFSFARVFVPITSLLLLCLWVSGYFYSELPAASLLALAAAAVFPWLIPTHKVREQWKALALHGIAVAIPAIVAVIIAFRASPALDY